MNAVSGEKVGKALQIAGIAIDGMIAAALGQAPTMLFARGFSGAELEAMLDVVRADLAAWRDDRMMALRAYLERRDGEAIN